jgi:hypothetical protein
MEFSPENQIQSHFSLKENCELLKNVISASALAE